MCVLRLLLADVLHEAHPTAVVRVAKVERLQALDAGKDEAYLAFELSADLTSAFSWNTKELFVFLGAEYESKGRKVNQVSLWDRTIESKEEAVRHLPYVRNKYKLVDRGHHLRGLKFNLTLFWHVVPVVGKLTQHNITFEGSQLPDEYVRPAELPQQWRSSLGSHSAHPGRS